MLEPQIQKYIFKDLNRVLPFVDRTLRVPWIEIVGICQEKSESNTCSFICGSQLCYKLSTTYIKQVE